ncbi:hypothetical protein JD844_005769 [Phrynosoma platyrhinos]|uniref:UPAR/Ly6 domain-containing protein n=1 Tax=Phrynosoma platyrhinos TaxID=52577 RepID=A0ABQ7TP80_PHRPL|nr:hypothetical protein JD844_005769 [Phrynosoma platyrhinos]
MAAASLHLPLVCIASLRVEIMLTSLIYFFLLLATGNERWVATYKGCTKKAYCFPPSVSFTFPSQRKRRAAKCCNKNLCNRGTVKLPPMQNKPNGLLCPGCFSTHSKCKATETIKCHGEERYCVYYDMTVEQGDQLYKFAKRGCGTKLACLNKPLVRGIPGLFVEVWKSAQCISAPRLQKLT